MNIQEIKQKIINSIDKFIDSNGVIVSQTCATMNVDNKLKNVIIDGTKCACALSTFIDENNPPDYKPEMFDHEVLFDYIKDVLGLTNAQCRGFVSGFDHLDDEFNYEFKSYDKDYVNLGIEIHNYVVKKQKFLDNGI